MPHDRINGSGYEDPPSADPIHSYELYSSTYRQSVCIVVPTYCLREVSIVVKEVGIGSYLHIILLLLASFRIV